MKIKILIISFFILFLSCSKDTNRIPYTPINIYLDINNAIYNELNSIGGFAYIKGGYKGLIVYRSSYDSFVAFERACPYHPTSDCDRLVVDTSGLSISDQHCGSQFLITDGSVVKGPSKRPSLVYGTMFDGIYLKIYN